MSGQIRVAFADGLAVGRQHGVRAAMRMLGKRAVVDSTTLWFERVAAEPPFVALRQELRILRVSAAERDALRDDLSRAGVDSERGLFDRGTVCYLAYWNGRPVGSGWRHRSSRLLARLRRPPGDVYVGGFLVLPEARKRGIYRALLCRMCQDIADSGAHVFAQTALDNVQSQQGLEKAGFHCVGRLHVVALFGCIVYCRMTPLHAAPID